jgi:hypothetical protein
MGGGSQEASSSQYDVTPPQYTRLRGPASRIFQEGFWDVGRDVTSQWGGPFVAEMSPEEQALVSQIGSYSPTLSPNVQDAEVARGRTIRGENLTPTEQFAPWARAINEAFQEGTLQNVGQFTDAGHRVQESSPFARSEAISDRARADALARVASDIYQTERGYQESAARAEEAVPAERAAANAGEIQNMIDQLSATALPRMIADLGIERGMEEFQRYIDTLLNFFGVGVQATMPTLATTSKSGGWNMFI